VKNKTRPIVSNGIAEVCAFLINEKRNQFEIYTSIWSKSITTPKEEEDDAASAFVEKRGIN